MEDLNSRIFDDLLVVNPDQWIGLTALLLKFTDSKNLLLCKIVTIPFCGIYSDLPFIIKVGGVTFVKDSENSHRT